MIDFKKYEFQHHLSNYISENPAHVGAAIEAITQGIENKIECTDKDSHQLAALLMLFMLKDKYGRGITKEERLLIVKYLIKYFDVKTFDCKEAIPLMEGMVKANERKKNDEKLKFK